MASDLNDFIFIGNCSWSRCQLIIIVVHSLHDRVLERHLVVLPRLRSKILRVILPTKALIVAVSLVGGTDFR